jgi:hypothetical protein
MDFKALLTDAGIPLDEAALLRHADRRRLRPPYYLWQHDRAAFERYQSMQKSRYFDLLNRSRYWAAFAANEFAETVFLGVYEARDPRLVDPPLPNEVDDSVTTVPHYVFSTTPLPHLAWLSGILKIQWSGADINWAQPALSSGNEIVAMTPACPPSGAHDTMREFVPYAPPLSTWTPVDRRPMTVQSRPVDAVAWMIDIERRSAKHEDLLRRVAATAEGYTLECSLQVDLVVDRELIIEVKSLEDDVVAQARAALAQLYHYRFVYRDVLPAAKLLVIFGRRPVDASTDFVNFLESCAIAVAWATLKGFEGTPSARAAAPWLFR